MKFFKILNFKAPAYKKFNYAPRFYNAEEEERKERISRIEREFNESKLKNTEESLPEPVGSYRERMRGSFQKARESTGGTTNAAAAMLRFSILLVLALGLLAYLQYGNVALYGMGLILAPLFLYSKFRNLSKKKG
jgi:Flp pilus assembly protein TadB